eukprot:FR739180.1.p4 GENE.FR739180.1~~FR739180.1.p4  ORF type:complete len:121 (+),score=18.82 FR739180.1:720-1082(+)
MSSHPDACLKLPRRCGKLLTARLLRRHQFGCPWPLLIPRGWLHQNQAVTSRKVFLNEASRGSHTTNIKAQTLVNQLKSGGAFPIHPPPLFPRPGLWRLTTPNPKKPQNGKPRLKTWLPNL